MGYLEREWVKPFATVSVVPGPAVSATPGDLRETQILRPIESESTL